MAGSGGLVRLRSPSGLLVSHEEVRVCADLRVYAAHGLYAQIPAVLLAIQSPLLKPVLLETGYTESNADPAAFQVVITELDAEDLSLVVNFLTSGILPAEITPKIRGSFLSLGIDLSLLSLSETFPSGEAAKVALQCDGQLVAKEEPPAEMEELVSEPILESEEHYFEEEMEEYDQDDEGMDLDASYEEQPPSKRRKRPVTKKEPDLNECLRKIKDCPWNDYPPKADEDTPDPNVIRRRYMHCYECGFKTLKSKVYEQHVLHHRVKEILDRTKYHCTVLQCLQECASEADWIQHGKEVHKGKMYQCFHCDRTYPSSNNRNTHMIRSHEISAEDRERVKMVCVHCGSREEALPDFTRMDAYRKHMRYESVHHSNVCAYKDCNESFDSWLEHKAHIEKFHNNVQVYICGICTETFDSKVKKTHHRMGCHPEEMKNFVKQCDICGKHTNALSRHMALEHNQDAPGYCVACAQEVPDYRNHMDVVHAERWKKKVTGSPKSSDALLCTMCGESFTSRSGMASHMRFAHRDTASEESLCCPVCEVTFTSSISLKSHIARAHRDLDESEKLIVCPSCPKMFASKRSLQYHSRSVHELPFCCTFCHKRFQSKELLIQHKEEGCKNSIMVRCQHCDKTMAKARLKMHIMHVHTPDEKKPYKCSVCHKGFIHQYVLKDHMNLHTNERPFKCTFCDWKFKHRSVWIMHERNVHKRECKTTFSK